MGRPQLVLTGVVAAVALASLVGCSEDAPRPKIASSDSSSAAETPSPSPTGPVEPTLPPEAKEPTKAGAEAFVKHYWAMVNYAQASGDVEALRRMSSTGCQACAGGLRFIEDAVAAGAHIRGGALTATVLRSEPLVSSKTSSFRVVVMLKSERQVVDHPGDVKDEIYPAGQARTRMVVHWINDHWIVGFWE